MDEGDHQLIEWQLTRLVTQFCHCIDKRRYDELAGLFTEDGVFDRVGQELRGRAAIREAMDQRHAYLTRHCVANLLFTRVEPDEAAATMYVVNFVGQPDADGLPVAHAMEAAVLEFDDVYRRMEDGWKISRRTARLVIKPTAAGH